MPGKGRRLSTGLSSCAGGREVGGQAAAEAAKGAVCGKGSAGVVAELCGLAAAACGELDVGGRRVETLGSGREAGLSADCRASVDTGLEAGGKAAAELASGEGSGLGALGPAACTDKRRSAAGSALDGDDGVVTASAPGAARAAATGGAGTEDAGAAAGPGSVSAASGAAGPEGLGEGGGKGSMAGATSAGC
jgi:hypothetical protein